MNILIVDDEPGLAAGLAGWLKEALQKHHRELERGHVVGVTRQGASRKHSGLDGRKFPV